MIGERELRACVRRMGRRIARHYRGRELVLVGILNGSFVFMADLIRAVRLPLTCEFVRAASYGRGTRRRGAVRVRINPGIKLAGRDVLIVEDIVDTGRTMDALIREVRRRRPRSLRVCALLHKPDRAEVRVPIDFLGFEIPNRFVVGYGLDRGGRYRNLPYVGVLDGGS